jgi:quercetin dioxygenase-like cupin family protein
MSLCQIYFVTLLLCLFVHYNDLEKNMFVKHSSTVEKEDISAGKNTQRQVLISAEEGPNFSMRLFTIEPQGEMPLHKNSVEHEQYVVGGRAQIGIGEETYTVETGDVVFIPANTPHWYRTIGDQPFKFLCMVPNQKDEITIL